MNLDAIRDRLNQLKNSGGGGSRSEEQKRMWRPESGEQLIRIVPYKFNKDNPFIELKIHFNLGGKHYISPISFGKKDPIVEFASALKQTGSKEDWKLGRQMEPKLRVYVPILVRGKEEEGVKFYAFGKQVYETLLGYMSDPDYGDITDPSSGRDVKITYKTKEESDTDFAETDVMVKPNQTPILSGNLANDKELLKKITEGQVELVDNISKLKNYEAPTYDELKVILQNHVDPDGENETKGGETIVEGTTTDDVSDEASTDETSNDTIVESTPAMNKSDKAGDVGKKFDNLFNE